MWKNLHWRKASQSHIHANRKHSQRAVSGSTFVLPDEMENAQSSRSQTNGRQAKTFVQLLRQAIFSSHLASHLFRPSAGAFLRPFGKPFRKALAQACFQAFWQAPLCPLAASHKANVQFTKIGCGFSKILVRVVLERIQLWQRFSKSVFVFSKSWFCFY